MALPSRTRSACHEAARRLWTSEMMATATSMYMALAALMPSSSSCRMSRDGWMLQSSRARTECCSHLNRDALAGAAQTPERIYADICGPARGAPPAAIAATHRHSCGCGCPAWRWRATVVPVGSEVLNHTN